MVAPIQDSPINRYPASLLGFLDIKAMGNNPRFLEQRVQPSIDLLKFYMGGARQGRSFNLGSITGNGYKPAVNAVVPQNKAWIVDNIWLSGPGLLDNEVLSMAPTITQSTGFIMLGPITSWSGVTASSPIAIAPWDLRDEPIICPAGYRFEIFIARVAGITNFTVTINVSYVEADF